MICVAELAAQDVVALLADADDLDRLALRRCSAVGVVARKARDRGVERAAEAALGGADDEQVASVGAGAGEQRAALRRRDDARARLAEHRRHALGVGPRGLGRHLGAAQLRRRDHLHGLGDLLRRLHGGDAVAQVFQARPSRVPTLSGSVKRSGERLGEGVDDVLQLLPRCRPADPRVVRIESRMSACLPRRSEQEAVLEGAHPVDAAAGRGSRSRRRRSPRPALPSSAARTAAASGAR